MASQNAEANQSAGAMPERRERLQHTIDSLIKLRQEVVLSYCKLSGVSSFAKRDLETHRINADQLRSFCQIMVDYTAMGHFEVYQRIIEGKERRVAVKQVSDEVYPAIAETTDFLVDFNDKYDAFDGSAEDVELLAGDLSRLGQIIAIRGELEDQILDALQQKK
jgi:regulator of sigma D